MSEVISLNPQVSLCSGELGGDIWCAYGVYIFLYLNTYVFEPQY